MRMIVLVVVAVVTLAGAEAPPSPAQARERVAALLEAHAAEGPATLGVLNEAIGLALQAGVPAYNSGDVQGCARIYRATAELIDTHLGHPFEDAAGLRHPAPLTQRALELIATAQARAAERQGADAQAWSLRFGFDRVMLLHSLEVAHASQLVNMGTQAFRRGDFLEAEAAFVDATAIAWDVQGSDPTALDASLRIAPLALGHAQLAQHRFHDAAESVQLGLRWMPEWTEQQIRQRDFYNDERHYDRALRTLERAVAEAPDDADLLFQLAYERHFDNRRDEAARLFQRVLRLDPDHAGARVFVPAPADDEAAEGDAVSRPVDPVAPDAERAAPDLPDVP